MCFARGVEMFEVVEAAGEWIVRHAGKEVARYEAQAAALQAVAQRMREHGGTDHPVAFAIRFAARDAL